MANNPNALKTITRAIVEKHCVAIRRDDRSRLIAIEPHALYSDKDRGIVLDFYQPPITSFDKDSKGIWDSIPWRKISAAFWLNTSFEPRFKRGFDPAQKKYLAGLLAIVDTGNHVNKDQRLWEQIETSLDRILANTSDVGKKH